MLHLHIPDLNFINVTILAAALASTITGIIALCAGVYAFTRDRITRKISLANLYVTFMDRYNDVQMYDSLMLLTDYYKEKPETFVERWHADRAKGGDRVEKLKVARRIVDRFYWDIAQLYDARLIKRKFARVLSAQWGVNVYFLICEPMIGPKPPKSEKNYYDIMRRVRTRFGEGKIF